MQTPRAGPADHPDMDHPTRRGNYDSGQDYVLEYGELRFTFNERDFSERVEQAALKLGFVGGRLESVELEDLVNLTVNGEVQDPASGLGEHVNDCWPELVGPSERSLVHWLRRLVFRSAWLDQRVKEGELDVVFDESNHSFGYVQPERDDEPIELSPEPNWGRVAYMSVRRRATSGSLARLITPDLPERRTNVQLSGLSVWIKICCASPTARRQRWPAGSAVRSRSRTCARSRPDDRYGHRRRLRREHRLLVRHRRRRGPDVAADIAGAPRRHELQAGTQLDRRKIIDGDRARRPGERLCQRANVVNDR